MFLQIQCNPAENSSTFFFRNRKPDLKIYMDKQQNWNSENYFEKEIIWMIQTTLFQELLYKGTVVKTVWYIKKICIQTNGAEQSPGTDGHMYGQSIFHKGANVIQGERKVFHTNGAETLGHLFIQGQKLPNQCPSRQSAPSSNPDAQSSQAIHPRQGFPFESFTGFPLSRGSHSPEHAASCGPTS